jgi:hypothetical protein
MGLPDKRVHRGDAEGAERIGNRKIVVVWKVDLGQTRMSAPPLKMVYRRNGGMPTLADDDSRVIGAC